LVSVSAHGDPMTGLDQTFKHYTLEHIISIYRWYGVCYSCKKASKAHSPEEEDDEGTETEGIDVDDAEGGNFDKEDAEEEYIGGF